MTSLDNENAQRLLSCYLKYDTDPDQTARLVTLLNTVHTYNWSIVQSNEINARQGKSRFTYSSDSVGLMNYPINEDIDSVTDKRLNELVIRCINEYLMDKQILPDKPLAKAGMIARVKSLLIKLFANGMYGILPELNVPVYATDWVVNALDQIQTTQDTVLNEYILYLEESGNIKLADIAKSVGPKFLVSGKTKGISNFQRYTENVSDLVIVDYDQVYNKYLEARKQCIQVIRNLASNSLFKVFDISIDSYHTGIRNVMAEFENLFTDDVSVKLIRKLTYDD